jgi:exodeoxyribonuclease V alpha subunit
LGLELAGRTVVSDTIADRECVFLAHLWHAERLIAERLRDIANGKPPWPAIVLIRPSLELRASSA